MFSNGPIIWLHSVTSTARTTGLPPAGGAPGADRGQGHTGGAAFYSIFIFFLSSGKMFSARQTDSAPRTFPPPNVAAATCD